MQNLTPDSFWESVLRIAPEFRSQYEEHLEDNQGELLDHLLMGDLTRFVLAQSSTHSAVPTQVKDLLSLLEDGINSSNEHLVNMVAASFVENLQDEPALVLIRGSLGPGLTAQLREFEA